MSAARPGRRTGAVRVSGRLIEAWALGGGAVLCAVVAMHALSVAGVVVFGRPFPGDLELTELGVAVAAFAFLPYCQLTGANVTADIFTARAKPKFLRAVGALSSAIALAFAALLLWRMTEGLLDARRYSYQTTVLAIPTWVVFVPILVSLALLALASIVSLVSAVEGTAAPQERPGAL